MANSAGRRKSIRKQNTAMRKALARGKNPTVVQEAASAIGGGTSGTKAGIRGLLGGSKVKGIGSSILGMMMLQRLLRLPEESGNRAVRREAMSQQAESITPESMYLQAALPQAQQEEEMARQALFAQLTGGVIGPSLATGETRIGR